MSWTITGTEKVTTDPYRSQVSLLLHGDGTNGSTTITDSSPSPKTVTAVGNAQISTAIADPFGKTTGVMAFDGNGDYLSVSGTTAFPVGTEDFTVEFWLQNSDTTWNRLVRIIENSVTNGFQVYIASNGNLNVSLYGVSGILSTSLTALALNSWHHIAIARNGNNFQAYINGASSQSGTSSGSFASISTQNISDSSNSLKGYIDDLRITKGVARYTSNFTPPTAPFPDI